jgi:hypothetical protein
VHRKGAPLAKALALHANKSLGYKSLQGTHSSLFGRFGSYTEKSFVALSPRRSNEGSANRTSTPENEITVSN